MSKLSQPGMPSPLTARLFLVLAAFLWSTSGAFTKVLREDTALGLNVPPVAGLQIAFFRVIFGGIVLLPLVRPSYLTFRRAMIGAAICFAVMNALFVSALAEGKAANAIFL